MCWILLVLEQYILMIQSMQQRLTEGMPLAPKYIRKNEIVKEKNCFKIEFLYDNRITWKILTHQWFAGISLLFVQMHAVVLDLMGFVNLDKSVYISFHSVRYLLCFCEHPNTQQIFCKSKQMILKSQWNHSVIFGDLYVILVICVRITEWFCCNFGVAEWFQNHLLWFTKYPLPSFKSEKSSIT